MTPFWIFTAAGLYALAFPKFGFWFLAFCCLIPLFAALERSRSLLQIFLFAVCWGGFHGATMGSWLFPALIDQYEVIFYKALLFFVLFVWLPLSILSFCYAVAYRVAVRNHLLSYLFIVPAGWILTEFAKTRLPMLIPWGDLGYALMPFEAFVQSADVVGVYGISYLAVMVNGAAFYLIKRLCMGPASSGARPFQWQSVSRQRGRILGILLIIGMIISGPVAYGQWRLGAVERSIEANLSRGEGINAIVVQGNYSAKDRWSGMGFEQRLRTYLTLSGEGEENEERLIVWPETILNETDRLEKPFFLALMQWMGSKSLLIAGGVHETSRNDRPRLFNSAFFISGDGRIARYDKHKLLPYAEAAPEVDLLGRYYNAPEHFSPGRSPLAISSSMGTIGASICFEILYSDFIRSAVSSGAQILVNLSNDSWFGNTAMPHVHLYAAQMRAIENRRFLLRAANSGISAVISPAGKVENQSGLFRRQRIRGRVLLKQDQTLFTRYGNWMIYMAGAILVIGLIASVRGFDPGRAPHFG